MPDKTEADVATIGVRLIDDAYLAWFDAESECETTLREWFQATEGGRAHPLPERAGGELRAAAAAFVGADVALPEVHDLPERADPGQLTEQPFDQRGAAAAQPADEE